MESECFSRLVFLIPDLPRASDTSQNPSTLPQKPFRDYVERCTLRLYGKSLCDLFMVMSHYSNKAGICFILTFIHLSSDLSFSLKMRDRNSPTQGLQHSNQAHFCARWAPQRNFKICFIRGVKPDTKSFIGFLLAPIEHGPFGITVVSWAN